jgi:predicted nucleic acid-binding protein
MNVLVDTSVWVDHFKNRNTRLKQLLLEERVLVHPMVLLELACGMPPARDQTLAGLGLLQSSGYVGTRELMEFIERRQFHGRGCGLVDLTLLASTLVTPDTELWTLDKRLSALAEECGVLYQAA